MSLQNYSNIASQLASATRTDKDPFLDDIVNYKTEFAKGSLQAFGGSMVSAKAAEGVKMLRTKLRGVAKSKYGFDDSDLDEIQNSLESGDTEQALAKLSSKITDKITDAGRSALQGIKDKITGIKDLQEDAMQGLSDARAKASDLVAQADKQTIPKMAPARDQLDDVPDINQASNGEEMIGPLNRQIARYNNLDGRAQNRVNQKVKDDLEPRTEPDIDVKDLPEDHPDLDVIRNNFTARNQAIREEEQNPETTFKDPEFQANPADDGNYINKADPANPARPTKNPEEFDNPAEEEEVGASVGEDEAGAAADELASAATKAASIASKAAATTEDVTATLGGLTEASTALDWNPVGWLATAGLGIATLFTGLELKAHKKKFETPPNLTKSYAEQADV